MIKPILLSTWWGSHWPGLRMCVLPQPKVCLAEIIQDGACSTQLPTRAQHNRTAEAQKHCNLQHRQVNIIRSTLAKTIDSWNMPNMANYADNSCQRHPQWKVETPILGIWSKLNWNGLINRNSSNSSGQTNTQNLNLQYRFRLCKQTLLQTPHLAFFLLCPAGLGFVSTFQ